MKVLKKSWCIVQVILLQFCLNAKQSVNTSNRLRHKSYRQEKRGVTARPVEFTHGILSAVCKQAILSPLQPE